MGSLQPANGPGLSTGYEITITAAAGTQFSAALDATVSICSTAAPVVSQVTSRIVVHSPSPLTAGTSCAVVVSSVTWGTATWSQQYLVNQGTQP